MTAGPFEDATAARNKGDYATALRLLRPLADQGDAAAQYNLGIMYRNGQGAPQDFAEAAKWYRLAADQGDAAAQYNLGILYDNGSGVPQDHILARKWFNLSAAQGYQYAMDNRDTAAPETQKSTVAVIDALLTRDLLDWTRRDLKSFRHEAVAGSLRPDDEKYVCQLYARIPASKAPYVPEASWSATPYPIEQNWLEGFIGRITLVGAVIVIPIVVLIIVGTGISAFLETNGSLPNRIVMGILGAGLAALVLWFLFGLAARVVMICLSAVGLGFRAVYWLLVGK